MSQHPRRCLHASAHLASRAGEGWCIVATRRAQRDHLTQALEEAEAKLRDARADRKETERDRRMADAVEQLKRFLPGAASLVQQCHLADAACRLLCMR